MTRSDFLKLAHSIAKMRSIPFYGSYAKALGARLRAWRHDAYRTRLKDEQKRTLAKVAVVGAPDGAEAAWQVEAALAEGVEFTRELVSEPPNVIYPESFVESARDLAALGYSENAIKAIAAKANH